MARVLILDDDLAALAVAKRAVRAAGHDAITVVNAADARAALDAPMPPDVLLASPGADSGEALALAEKTRLDPARARIAVLLIGEPARPGFQAIARPIDGVSLGARISEVLATARAAAPAPAARSATPPPPRPQQRGPGAVAESALRALFRRPPAAPSRPPAPAAAPRSPPRDLLDAGASRQAGAGREVSLPELAALARTADYFAVLGLRRSASRGDITDAAARLLAELDACGLTPEGRNSPEIQEVRQVVIDARDVLSDDELRAAYLKGIEDVAEAPIK